MSYILDALKKSDQQRQRGATPTLQAAQVAVAAPKRPMFIYYSLLAAILLGAGIMIGWLHPWQPEQTSSASEPVAAETNILIPQHAIPVSLPTLPEMPGNTAREFPKQNPAPAGYAVSVTKAMKSDNPGLASSTSSSTAVMADESAMTVGDVHEQEAIPLNELPLQIQQEIPAMTVQLHAYASKPGERLVSINSIRLREGGFLMAGLRLEQITPDGMVFSYKGYRFRRGIQ